MSARDAVRGALAWVVAVSIAGAAISFRPWIFVLPVLAAVGGLLGSTGRWRRVVLAVAAAVLIAFALVASATIGLLYLPPAGLLLLAMSRTEEP